MTRHDNLEGRQAFSKNFGDFLDSKNAFVTQRRSSKGALSANAKDAATFKSVLNRSPKISIMEHSTIAGTTEIGSRFGGTNYYQKTPTNKPVRVLHMTQPDDRFSKVLFSQQTAKRPGDNTVNRGADKGPKSLQNGSLGNMFNVMGGFLSEANRTMNGDELNMSKLGGSVTRQTGVGSRLRQTLHVTAKEQDRVERFKTVRENAVDVAVDKQAKH